MSTRVTATVVCCIVTNIMCSFTKKLQLLGDEVPQTSPRPSTGPWTLLGNSVPQTHSLLLCPLNNPVRSTPLLQINSYSFLPFCFCVFAFTWIGIVQFCSKFACHPGRSQGIYTTLWGWYVCRGVCASFKYRGTIPSMEVWSLCPIKCFK